MSARRSGILVFCLALALAGCSTAPEDKTPTAPPVTAFQPVNDTPQHAILRLIAAYEQKKYDEYAALFTGDFTYGFGTVLSPSWFRADEDSAALHLFRGGVNMAGEYMIPASEISLTFAQTLPGNDPEKADTARYKVLGTRVDGWIKVPSYADTLTNAIDAESHRFWLVRGDAASGVVPGQPSDPTRWYVWKWRDETTLLPAAASASTTPASLGGWSYIKSVYR